MLEIREALEVIYRPAMTVWLILENNPTAIRMRQRHSLTDGARARPSQHAQAL